MMSDKIIYETTKVNTCAIYIQRVSGMAILYTVGIDRISMKNDAHALHVTIISAFRRETSQQHNSTEHVYTH